jgi:hypothetical protein
LQAVHFFNVVSSHSSTPQEAQQDNLSASFSSLISIHIDAPTRYYRQSAALEDSAVVTDKMRECDKNVN